MPGRRLHQRHLARIALAVDQGRLQGHLVAAVVGGQVGLDEVWSPLWTTRACRAVSGRSRMVQRMAWAQNLGKSSQFTQPSPSAPWRPT